MGRKRTALTSTQPSDWNTNYNSYFTMKTLNDIFNDSSECPWKVNTYYYNDSGTFKAWNNTPTNWAEEYKNCCIFIQNNFPKCPPDWKPRTFYINESGNYILTETEPLDWSDSYNKYFIQNTSTLNFEKCNFSIPNWADNIYYKRKLKKDIQRSIIHTGVVVGSYNNSSTLT